MKIPLHAPALVVLSTIGVACSPAPTMVFDAASDGSIAIDGAPISMPTRTLARGRVLMIGNSHTSFSSTGTRIPELWHALNPEFVVESIASPGLALADHAASASTLRALTEGVGGRGPYDVVVLQEQSSRYLQGGDYDASSAAELVRAAQQGNPCVLVVFSQIQVDEASRDPGATLLTYRATSAHAAQSLAAMFAPIGDVFASVRTDNRALYQDLLENLSCCGYHARPLGGYVHALVLDMLVTGNDASAYSALNFDADKTRMLREATAVVMSQRARLRVDLALPYFCSQ